MLQELYISNLALIDKAQVKFGDGLNILTGETGAGKTVVVGAVNLLLGGRADTSLIRRGSSKASIQGLFAIPNKKELKDRLRDLLEIEDDEGQLIIRRELSLDGKNKCFINDRLVTVATLSDIARQLVDLHGQHEHQSLFKVSSHLNYLDKYGGKELIEARRKFKESSERFRSLKAELELLSSTERELLGKKDLLQFQINEISKASLKPNEDIELTRERDILRSAEKIYSAVAISNSLISENPEGVSAADLLAQAVSGLRAVSNIDDDLDELVERLNSLLIEVEDCASSLRDYALKLDFPPGRLQEVEDRLALISLLKKKYGSTIEEIHDYLEQASKEYQLCDTSSDRIEKLEKDIGQAQDELSRIAADLSNKRKEVADRFAKEVEKELADLNMPNASFVVSFIREQDEDGLLVDGEKVRFHAYGIDKVEFLVSANKSEPPMSLMKIASGGEVSRIMLALKIVLADADDVPTLIFDEIDTGVGGKTATSIGQKMSLLSRRHQVLAVTHLPQIASFADKHFTIIKSEERDRTVTEIYELLDRERIDEMARLLSGNAHSVVSLKHAEELIEEARKTKYGLVDGRAN
ncbi:MAG: DNA repair protein RecN [Firmicutes bacterium]|nr:DNA repair protein RecN [Bacillota bacterium]